MVRLKIGIGIIAAIIVVCIWGFIVLKHETNQLVESIDKTRSLANSGKTEEALESVDNLLKDWEEYHVYASVLVNNDKISAVQSSVSRLKPLIENQNDELNAEFETAESALKWIVESEIPRLTNIL